MTSNRSMSRQKEQGILGLGPNRVALRIASGYVAAASVWILVSDRMTELFDPHVSQVLQTYKGIAFVVVTGAVLYLLVRKWANRCESSTRALSRAETEARELVDRYRTLVENSMLAIVMLDGDGNVSGWNPAAERMFGWTADEILGRPNPIVPPEDAEEYHAVLNSLFEEERSRTLTARRVRKDGELIDVHIYTASMVDDDGTARGAMAILLDITEQLAAEAELRENRERLEEAVADRTRELILANDRLKRATRVKSEFLTNMSHELRTPLNSIIGFSGVLLQGLAGPVNEQQTQQLTMIYKAGQHLLALINDILDLSKIEAGRAVVSTVDFDLRDLISSAVDAVREEARGKGLAVESAMPDVPLRTDTDRAKVQQIVSNLLSNAVKFTAEGSVYVKVESLCEGERFKIVVADTGPGIPDREQAAVFDEFVQSTRRAEGKPAGTGMGLAISRRLARMLGGDVTLRSVVGEGSEFALELPSSYEERLARDGIADVMPE